ncbi:MAG: recombinase family protein [bacterium]
MSNSNSLIDYISQSLQDRISPTADVKKKGYLWARVSTNMQMERKLSVHQQKEEIREFAEKQGIEIVAEFEESTSAYQNYSKRVEFRRMIELAKTNREIGYIIVHDFSRFSRDSLRARTMIRELRDKGVEVLSVNDPVIDHETSAGSFMEAMTFAKNEAFSRDMSFHIKKGLRANIQSRDPESGWCFKNGGSPLWGYKIKHIQQIKSHSIRLEFKQVWAQDDTLVADKPVHEWVRYCLVEMAAKGASQGELRDFCNNNGIPGRTGGSWNTSSWASLLNPQHLLQYTGRAVYNVRSKSGVRPMSEWIIVEDAHEAIITEDEAKTILLAREAAKKRNFDAGYSRSRKSTYVLSGGLFKCSRCGNNMCGFKQGGHRYYVCGSQPNRKGFGCGKGVYIPTKLVESEVIEGLKDIFDRFTDTDRLIDKVNKEIQQIWKSTSGYDPKAARKIKEIDKKISNIRKALEDGLNDAAWANQRLSSLTQEREELTRIPAVASEPPFVDNTTISNYLTSMEQVIEQNDPEIQKRLVRKMVHGITFEPEKREVEITYQAPQLFMHCESTVYRGVYQSCHSHVSHKIRHITP